MEHHKEKRNIQIRQRKLKGDADMNNSKQNNKRLTEQQKRFCREYVKTGNGMQSAIKAGYKKETAVVQASRLLTKDNIKAEIDRLNEKKEKSAIMSAQEVMEMFTKIANGEIKDQFGLDASLNDRLKALQELAKRTIDIENRIKGVPDGNISIKLDWSE